jgi:2-dehydropantoate 2-reductase
MSKRMAVLGTGGIGSCIGADLTRAGHQVLLIDQWPAHVEAMKSRGLSIALRAQELQVPVQALHLCELATLKPELDLVFLTVKSYDTRWTVELIKPYLKPDGVLVSAQNSFNDEWIVPIIGHGRDIGSAFELSAEVLAPGMVKRNTDHAVTRFVLGELHGRITPRLEDIAAILRAVGHVELSTNIWGAKWSKLVLNTMSMALGTIGGLRSWELAQNPRYLALAVKLGRETVNVGAALGYALEPLAGLLPAKDLSNPTDEELQQLVLNLVADVGKDARNAMLQDQTKGRLTEVAYLNGLVVSKGREVNVPTPWNEKVTALVKQIEGGHLKPDAGNLNMLVA